MASREASPKINLAIHVGIVYRTKQQPSQVMKLSHNDVTRMNALARTLSSCAEGPGPDRNAGKTRMQECTFSSFTPDDEQQKKGLLLL